MRARKNKAPGSSVSNLAERELLQGADETVGFPARIARYAVAKKRAVTMRDYLEGRPAQNAVKARAGLSACGEWLHFREYYTVDKIRLHAASFCKQHLICPLCAIRRGAKSLAAYLARYEVIRAQHPYLSPYLVTLTVKNGPDLAERFEHLHKSLKLLIARRRRFEAGSRGAPWTELCLAEGAVYTFEVTNKGNGWHPHVHMIALCPREPSQEALRGEWERITADSFMVDVRAFDASQEPVEGFMEVFKYAVKFSDLSPEDNWHAAQVFKGRRLLGSFGLFRGVEIPESMTDEPLDGLPYVDRFYRFLQGEYQFTGESPKSVDEETKGGGEYQPTPEGERLFPLPAGPELPLRHENSRRGAKTTPKSMATLWWEAEERRKRNAQRRKDKLNSLDDAGAKAKEDG
ncbi:protein rep [Pseudomonas aeruginosa]|nr:protein rep [Pseudomonas aeruginosa]